MAAIALVFGSVFGFFGAFTGWALFGLTFASAFTLYLGVSVGLGLLAITMQALRGENTSMAQPA